MTGLDAKEERRLRRDQGALWRVTRFLESALAAGFALIPALGILYLHLYQNPTLLFEDHLFHEVAISAAIVISGLVSLVTWRCYQTSGETFLRWLALGFLSFTIIYAPHGILTRLAHAHNALFLLFGPLSRLAMSILFLQGLLQYGRPAESTRKPLRYWVLWTVGFFAIDLLAAMSALSPLGNRWLIRSMESLAFSFFLSGLAIVFLQRISAPLMKVFSLSLAAFAQSSLAFLTAAIWNHQWWYAHLIFAAGFFFISYGVLRAFHTTRAFSLVYSQEEMMRQLTEARDGAVDALEQLKLAHNQLEQLAVSDPLTSASNRRHFFDHCNIEISRALRKAIPLSIIMIDLDHFKLINDRHGHAAGDAVLRAFADGIISMVRPGDMLGRLGGEEFAVLLPDASIDDAIIAAERFRLMTAGLRIPLEPNGHVTITMSAGVAQLGQDGDSTETILRTADRRLYAAKDSGRDTVIAG